MVAWAESVCRDWQERVDAGEVVPEGDDFAFWTARYDEAFKQSHPGRVLEYAGDDWWHECQRIHGGKCNGQAQHRVQLILDKPTVASATIKA
jgi:hypothetical protein